MNDTDPAPRDRGAPASSRRTSGGRHPFFGGQPPGEQQPSEDAWWTRSPGEPQRRHPFWGDAEGVEDLEGGASVRSERSGSLGTSEEPSPEDAAKAGLGGTSWQEDPVAAGAGSGSSEDSFTAGARSASPKAVRQESVAESGASEAWPKASGATFREENPAEVGSADEFTAASVDLPFAEDHGGPSSVGQADGPSDPHAGS